MVQFIASFNYYYHRKFAFQYIPKFVQAVEKYLLESPPNTIRNMSKEKIDLIFD